MPGRERKSGAPGGAAPYVTGRVRPEAAGLGNGASPWAHPTGLAARKGVSHTKFCERSWRLPALHVRCARESGSCGDGKGTARPALEQWPGRRSVGSSSLEIAILTLGIKSHKEHKRNWGGDRCLRKLKSRTVLFVFGRGSQRQLSRILLRVSPLCLAQSMTPASRGPRRAVPREGSGPTQEVARKVACGWRSRTTAADRQVLSAFCPKRLVLRRVV